LVCTCRRPAIGGSGFVNKFPVEKFDLRAKAGTIYEGTSFTQLAAIAKML
jgi:alkylation response protein AidB-like acyl-CoA dehydrogenase